MLSQRNMPISQEWHLLHHNRGSYINLIFKHLLLIANCPESVHYSSQPQNSQFDVEEEREEEREEHSIFDNNDDSNEDRSLMQEDLE
jgi:hypothetical protein